MAASIGGGLAVVILAAGKGKRMGNPDLAKVLTELDGKPLLHYVVEQAALLNPEAVVVIVGHQHLAVEKFAASVNPNIVCIVQSEQLGTGHAVLQAQAAISDAVSDVLILSGDVPLLSAATLLSMLEQHQITGASLTVLTTTLADPQGYGRIVRTADGEFLSIVEQKDASVELARINEINSGVYLVKAKALFNALAQVKNTNAQGEYYLTDIVSIMKADGARVEAFHSSRWQELHGVNSPTDLARAAELRSQMQEQAC